MWFKCQLGFISHQYMEYTLRCSLPWICVGFGSSLTRRLTEVGVFLILIAWIKIYFILTKLSYSPWMKISLISSYAINPARACVCLYRNYAKQVVNWSSAIKCVSKPVLVSYYIKIITLLFSFLFCFGKIIFFFSLLVACERNKDKTNVKRHMLMKAEQQHL